MIILSTIGRKRFEQPLPHLIIVVDEFAELKSDQPEFMQRAR